VVSGFCDKIYAFRDLFNQGLLPAIIGSALSGYFRLEQPRRVGYLPPGGRARFFHRALSRR
jgi:hypothetical protein